MRDILFCTGLLDGDTFTFLKPLAIKERGGKKPRPIKEIKVLRFAGKLLILYKVKNHHKVGNHGGISTMTLPQKSIKLHLRAKYKASDVHGRERVQSYVGLLQQRFGFQTHLEIHGACLINYYLIIPDGQNEKEYKAFCFKRNKNLIQNFGQYKGYPFRTFSEKLIRRLQ